MKKTSLLIPTLSTLLLSTAVLGNVVSAEETAATPSEVTSAVDSPVAPVESIAISETPAAAESTQPVAEEAPAPEAVTPSAEAPAVAVATPEASAVTSSAPSDTVTILHTNDIHGRIEEGRDVIGVAKLATVVEETRQQGTTLVLDAGDAFQGMPISNSTKGEDLAAIMNEIGYDAMAVGNHEFDFGLDQAKKYSTILNFPLLSANVYVDGARIFKPSTIVDKTPDVAGDEFVVIGVTTPETATKTHPNNVKGVSFTDPVTEVNAVISQIESSARAEGKTYKNYIVLAHLGVDATTPKEWQGSTLAEALSKNAELAGKNVILIDGHSHTLLSQTYGGTTYNQTGSYLNNIGKIILNASGILSTGVITAADTASVTPNAAITAKVDAIKAKFAAENAKVVAETSPVELNGDRENVRVRETNQGNAITDALWIYGQTGFAHKTNLAVMNGGGIRATIKSGQPITVGDVISVLPFGNIISQIEVTGQTILDMYTKALSADAQVDKDGNPILDENGRPLLEANGGFLQTSGAFVYYDTALPKEERILFIEIYDHETNSFLPLDLSKTYYLATNDFLAAGGDGYTMLGGSREEGPSLDQVYADYLGTADLTDYAEVAPNSRLISMDTLADSDEDGFLDIYEYILGTDPFDGNDYPNLDPENKPQDKGDKGVRGTKSQANQPAVTPLGTGRVTKATESTKVPVTYDKSEKRLPETGSETSLMAVILGASLVTLAAYGASKKRYLNN